MKKIAVLLVLVLLAPMLFAQNESGMTTSSALVLQASSLPEAKLGFTQSFRFPFLQGEGPLTAGNNVNLDLTLEASPISLNFLVDAIWTPIAFIEVAAGGRIGTGWPLELFGNDLYGIGLNLPGEGNIAVHDGSAFDGLLWQAYFGGAFQFDLAAVFPGAWNSVIFRTYHEINYHGYTSADADQAWFFENDDGENMNGFNYYGNIVLGYQMPIFLNMVALMAEMDLYMYDTPNRSNWGDDLIRWHFSGILNFRVFENFSITVLCQFRTRRNFTEETKDLHFQSRRLDPEKDPQRLGFYRVAGVFTYRF